MKKVLAFAAFALIFASCSNTAKLKPMIEELTSNWDNTTSRITEFANTVKSEQSNWMTASKDMQVAPEAMAKWDDAMKAKYSEIQSAAEANSGNISGIASELDAFVSSWTEKGKEIKALQDGLASGKLGNDAQAKIAELTAAATDAGSKLADWQSKFDEVKMAAKNAKQMFAEFMTNSGSTTR